MLFRSAALNKLLKKYNVEILYNKMVKELLRDKQENCITGVLLNDGTTLKASRVIVTTGGKSYETTGSTGDGYVMAKKVGHTIVDCKPSLVPMNVKETWCKDAMGVSLKNVSFRLVSNQKEIFNEFGEMLITHFGISGPLVLSASSYYVTKGKGEVKGFIDLKPALSAEQLDKRILRDFEEGKNKQFKNCLNHL